MQFLVRRLTVFLAAVVVPTVVVAQQSNGTGPVSVSLADAVRIGERESESVRIARAGSDRAQGQRLQARSQLFPQIAGTASYQRAIQLEFAEIAKRVPAGTDSGSSGSNNNNNNSLGNSPLARVFASPNTMVFAITGSQTIYAGGRVTAGIAAADAGIRAAGLGARSARAQVVYDIAQAYFDAQVADQLLAISDSSLAQTERALTQTQLARQVGNTAEYDLIRARVQRDNTRPAVINARAQRDIAFLHLRQLLNIPLDRPLTLTTPIDPGNPSDQANATQLRAAGDIVAVADTSAMARTSVRQAAENVRASENQLRVARGQRLPAVSLSTNYQRFAYPAEGTIFEDKLNYYFPNWTVSIGVSMPFFTGGRQRGDEMVAQANLAEARERYQQTADASVLDARLAAAQFEQADARFAATAGTDEQAARGYSIAEVRFAEGIATQLELTQARVDLETARANRVQAARDLALARLRVALLNDLPLTAAPATATGGR
jgi:outer membrane protein TolC